MCLNAMWGISRSLSRQQEMLLDFAARGSREFGFQDEGTRDFESRESLVKPGPESIEAERVLCEAIVQDEVRSAYFAPFGIGDRDHGGLFDLGMFDEGRFDLGGIDIFAA